MIVKEFWNENNKDFAVTNSIRKQNGAYPVNMKSINFATVYEALLILTFSKFEKNLISTVFTRV